MATVSERIRDIVRVNINDDMQSRFTDTQLLTFFKQAIRRAQGAGYKKRLNFMRKTLNFNLLANINFYLLPADFIVQSGVWRTDTRKPVENVSENLWETQQGAQEVSIYIIDGGNILFASAPAADTPIKLKYYYNVNPDSLILSSQMPWSGKIDYPICEYVNLRAFHTDRYDLSADNGLLNDMEKAITDMYINLDINMAEARGPFT